MKHTPLLIIITLLLLGSCEMPEYPTTISGTLYTDSTLTTPVAGRQPRALRFHLLELRRHQVRI